MIKMGCRGSEEAVTCGLELISAPGAGSRKLCAANEHGVMTKCNTATTPAPAPARGQVNGLLDTHLFGRGLQTPAADILLTHLFVSPSLATL